ncbi:HAMP domain-containing protein [Pendulispora rubella]|uniref:HAMP domain-containing protein n=1 Tax=Pendulispora rubella TaxID=2741070 RepID=A0ABZ2KYF8_9BACT
MSTPVAPELRNRNWLINPRFQLKYTGMLVGVVAFVMLALGFVIGKTANTAAEYAQLATMQAEKAMKESQVNSQLTRESVLMSGNPELLKVVEEGLSETDRQAEANLQAVQSNRAAIEMQRKMVFAVLIFAGVALTVVLTIMGVFITRRVVGPVHKIKRLLRRVGTGRLVVTERLRRGDELEDLFDTFMQMTWSLKALQTGRIATLDATMRKAEATGASPEVLDGLRVLRAQMVLGLTKRLTRTSIV